MKYASSNAASTALVLVTSLSQVVLHTPPLFLFPPFSPLPYLPFHPGGRSTLVGRFPFYFCTVFALPRYKKLTIM
uniref:Secreted protein n=1 Tax=Echinococcus granulosus TaxID=6210 RepID=A0A068WDI9_ECHGR|nr:hypothetical protein EgrG_000808500 [Echinococcus granulosus]